VRAFAAIVRVSLRQVVGGRRWIVLSLLALLAPIVMWLSSFDLTAAQAVARYEDWPLPILLLLVLPVTCLVVGSGALGDERRDGTLSFLLVRPIPRSTITAAKLAAAWLAATLIAGTAGALAAATVAVRASTWAALLPTVVAVAVTAAAYCAVFMLLGHITSRAVLVGLVYLFVWESVVSFAAPSLANVSLSRIGLTAYVGMVPGSAQNLAEPLGSLAPGAGGAVVKAFAISLICILAGAFLLSRRDATGE
jgi:ABC-2 type transport system permease protein